MTEDTGTIGLKIQGLKDWGYLDNRTVDTWTIGLRIQDHMTDDTVTPGQLIY